MKKVVEICKALAKKIIEDNYKLDIIIGLSRGGWVPARFIADYLQVENLLSFGVKSYKGLGKKSKLKITEKIGANVKGKRILVVDDIVDTGETLVYTIKYLKKKGARSVKTCVLHYKDKISSYRPNYYGEKTDKWIVYPWEEIENKLKWS